MCPLLCPIGHIFCCALLYMAQPQTFNLFELLWQSEGLNPKPIELNLVLFILAKISCQNNCANFCASFCAYVRHIFMYQLLYSKSANFFSTCVFFLVNIHTLIRSMFYPLSITSFTFLKTLLCQCVYLSFI